jgi:hypothetical protein
MMKSWIAASTLLVVLLMPGSSAWAKPADLPSHNEIECSAFGDEPMPRKFELELEISPRGVTLKFGVSAAKPMATPSLDMVLPAYVEQWLQHMGDAVTRPGRAMNWSGFLGPIAPLQRWWTDNLRDSSEESETEDAEAVFEEMRSRSVPLGLVEVSY